MEKTGRTEEAQYLGACRARDGPHGLWVSPHYRGCAVTKAPLTGG